MVNRASLDKRPDEVATMFDDVAPKYDVVNDVLSMGQTRRWRKVVVEAMDVLPGQRVLDLAAGTGTSSEPYADAGIDVIACDFSLGMLKVGKRRRPDIDFIAGDATRLPFADNTFDASTISFGLRNVNEPKKALAEMLRVTKPGGKLVIAEFSQPVVPLWRTMYTEYLMRALPAIAGQGLLQPGRLRLPRRVHPRLAGPGPPGRLAAGSRLGERHATATSAAASWPCTGRRSRPGRDPPRARPHWPPTPAPSPSCAATSTGPRVSLLPL